MHLEAIESGNLNAWILLNRDLTLDPDSLSYGNELEFDIAAFPGWNRSDPETRERILAAAETYIRAHEPRAQEWIASHVLHRPDFAGYGAFRILLAEAPARLSALGEEEWRKWARTIVAVPDPSESEAQSDLAAFAYRYAPEETTDGVLRVIDRENADHGRLFSLGMIEACWDARLAAALIRKTADVRLSGESLLRLLDAILEREGADLGDAPARAVSIALADFSAAYSSGNEERMAAIGVLLLERAPEAGWRAVWPLVECHPSFGERLAERLAQEDRAAAFGKWKEKNLARLYLWLAERYPYDQDPVVEGAHFVSLREKIARWRDNLLTVMKARDSLEACKSLEEIAERRPDLDWLQWVCSEAEEAYRRKTWSPPSPETVLKLASESGMRIVESGEDLLNAVLESLVHLQGKLTGETPAAQFLWDKVGKNVYRPKGEESLSDYVKLHLEEDLKRRGVVANREVQINRKQGQAPGEDTDIRVEALAKGSQGEDAVTVIIETKGCWHKDLDTAMEEQLAKRYLNKGRCRHGLYLVGWYGCPSWDESDYKKKASPSWTLQEARDRFDSQASRLSEAGLEIRAFVLDVALK
jgi:hypothetical protein